MDLVHIKKTKGLIMSGRLAVETHYGRKTVTRRLINKTNPDFKLFETINDEKGVGFIMGESIAYASIFRPKYQVGDWCYIREPFTARAWSETDMVNMEESLGFNGEFWQDIPKPLRGQKAIKWIAYRGDMSFWYSCMREDAPGSEELAEHRLLYPLEHLVQAVSHKDDIKAFEQHRWYVGRFMPKWMSRTLVRIVDVSAQPLQDIIEADAVMEGFPLGHQIEKKSARGDFICYWNDLNANDSNEISFADNPWVWRYEWQLFHVEPFAHMQDVNPGVLYDHNLFEQGLRPVSSANSSIAKKWVIYSERT